MKTKSLITVIALGCLALSGSAQSQLTILPIPAPNYGRIGVNQFVPSNQLEITSAFPDPYFGSINGSSGLKLTHLINTNTPLANPSNKVLSVDGAGNVILVPDHNTGGGGTLTGANDGVSLSGTTVQLGGLCGSAAAATLFNNREIPMAGFNINFTMPALSTSQIILGATACSPVLPITARFSSVTDNLQSAGLFYNTTSSSSPSNGLAARAFNNSAGVATGVEGSGISNGGANAIGVGGNAKSSTQRAVGHIGINGNAANGISLSIAGNLDVLNSSSPQNIGHQTDINGGTNAAATNYGDQLLINTPGSVNYGVYASVTGAATNWAGYFLGDVQINSGSGPYALTVNGNVLCSGSTSAWSDKRFKRDITKLENVNDKIKKLSGYTYYFNTEEFKDKNFSKDQQIGLIAQELKEVFPQLVTEDTKGYMAVNYQGMVPVLLEAIKEQQGQLEKQAETMQQQQAQFAKQNEAIQLQQKQIDELKQLIAAGATNANTTSANRMAVNLSDKDAVVLNQNVPNPFAEQTIITYNIPQNADVAQLVFYDATGRQIKAIDITTKGAGQLNVYANDLTNGIYSYTLVIDGKVIDTKKMVKQQ